MEKCLCALLTGAALLVAVSASASVIVLDFQGIGNLNPIGEFHDDGEGTSHALELSPTTLTLVEDDGRLMFFQDANDAVLNVPVGSDSESSLLYTSSMDAFVDANAGLDAPGTLVGTLSLLAQFGNDGSVARFIDVGDAANQTRFDDLTVGSADRMEAALVELAGMALCAGVGVIALLFGRLRSERSLGVRHRGGSGRIRIRSVR